METGTLDQRLSDLQQAVELLVDQLPATAAPHEPADPEIAAASRTLELAEKTAAAVVAEARAEADAIVAAAHAEHDAVVQRLNRHVLESIERLAEVDRLLRSVAGVPFAPPPQPPTASEQPTVAPPPPAEPDEPPGRASEQPSFGITATAPPTGTSNFPRRQSRWTDPRIAPSSPDGSRPRPPGVPPPVPRQTQRRGLFGK